ncbi:MAG: hypothetical protein GW795_12265, partial [Cyanobacteria bacterium]|nr:hypothetical protein [Cyanobacteria bacterium CG_2015-04_32_10]
DGKVNYNDGVYFQFSLKGLGNVGNGGVASVLESDIEGYVDQFGQA